MVPHHAVFVQTVQLHRDVPALGSKSTSKRTAPQWQLPLSVRMPGVIVVGAEAYLFAAPRETPG
jgi:hypothetical protein